MAITLNTRERAVLAHVVVDPDAWIANSEAVFGTQTARRHLAQKVSSYAGRYDAAVARGNYKNRVQRDAEET